MPPHKPRLDEPALGPGKASTRPRPRQEPGRAARARKNGTGRDPGGEPAQDAIILAMEDAGRTGTGPGPAAGDAAPAAGDAAPAAPGTPAGSPPQAARGALPPLATPGPAPSWGKVLITTIRLWAERRRHPGGAGTGATRRRLSRRGRLLLVLGCIVALAVAAATVALSLSGTAAPRAGRARPARTAAPAAAALRAAAAARAQAAGWIMTQVGAGAIVSCDPQMCADLQHAGVPAGRLLVLGTGSTGPLGSDVIVSTAAVRQEFGARLTAVYAPVTLASFGTGSAQAAIRVVAPDGSAAYLSGLRTDVAARASAGRQLLGNPRIRATAAVRRALAAGQVDSRLLTVLAALATMHTVDVLAAAPPVPGASAGIPVRAAVITPGRPVPHHPRWPNTLRSLAQFLRNQQAPYRPGSIAAIQVGRHSALRVGFAAPSPLGLLGKS